VQVVRGAGSGVGGGADEGQAEEAHAGGGRAGEVDGGRGDAISCAHAQRSINIRRRRKNERRGPMRYPSLAQDSKGRD
jgi:hypothetical protein